MSKLNLKVLVKCEGKKFQTKITYEGGNKPEFKEQFDLGNCKAELIEIEVLDVGAFARPINNSCSKSLCCFQSINFLVSTFLSCRSIYDKWALSANTLL